MACPQQRNIEAKRLEKLTKYRQLAYETKERRSEYEILLVPLVIGALGGGIRQIMVNMGNVFENKDLLKRTICEFKFFVMAKKNTFAYKLFLSINISSFSLFFM